MSKNDKSQLTSRFSFLKDGHWWRRSVDDALLFLPYCIFPAVLLALANISLLFSMDNLSDMSSITTQTLEVMTQKLVVSATTSLLGIVLTVWSLTAWLNRLTSFSRYRLSVSTNTTNVQEKKEAVKQVLTDIAQNQAKLYKFWLVFSLYLLVPVVPLSVLLLAQTIAFSPTLKALNLFSPPAYVNVILLTGISIFMVLSAAMTVVGIATVSRLNSTYQTAANQSVKLFCKQAVALFALTAIILLANAIITAPQLIAVAFQTESKAELLFGVIGQIWFALTSSILWTISLCPLLELLRRDLIATS